MTDPYLDSLQKTLAAEHAAVYVVAYLGAQTSRSATPGLFERLDAAYSTHRGRRDQLAGLVRRRGADPVVSAVSYELPDVASGPDAVTASALRIEQACAVTYAYLVAHSPSQQRRFGVGALVDAAVRELGFGGKPQILPGR